MAPRLSRLMFSKLSPAFFSCGNFLASVMPFVVIAKVSSPCLQRFQWVPWTPALCWTSSPIHRPRQVDHLTILSPFIVLKNVFKASFPLPLVFSSIFCLLSDSVLKIVPHSWRTKFTSFEQSTYKRRFFEICFYYQTICWDMHLILWTRNIFVDKMVAWTSFCRKGRCRQVVLCRK